MVLNTFELLTATKEQWKIGIWCGIPYRSPWLLKNDDFKLYINWDEETAKITDLCLGLIGTSIEYFKVVCENSITDSWDNNMIRRDIQSTITTNTVAGLSFKIKVGWNSKGVFDIFGIDRYPRGNHILEYSYII